MTYLKRYKEGKLDFFTIERIIRHYDNTMTDDLDNSICRKCNHCLKEADGVGCEALMDNFLTKEGCCEFEEDK